MSIQLATAEDIIAEQVELTLMRLDQLHRSQKFLRYGQLFMNIASPFATWPELYYETDVGKARELIRKRTTDLQNWSFVNKMIDATEKMQWQNTSGKSSSQPSATMGSPSGQGTTESGIPKLSKFLADLPYSRLQKVNG